MSKQHLDDEMISRLHDWFEIPTKLELYKFVSVWLDDLKGDAWDEGHEAGFNDSSTVAGEYNSPNPYRGEQA